jgi:hypothetical protein
VNSPYWRYRGPKTLWEELGPETERAAQVVSLSEYRTSCRSLVTVAGSMGPLVEFSCRPASCMWCPSALLVRHSPFAAHRPSGLRDTTVRLTLQSGFIRSSTRPLLQSPTTRGDPFRLRTELLPQGSWPPPAPVQRVNDPRALPSRSVPPSSFLSSSTAYSSLHLVGLFHPTGTRGVATFRGFPFPRAVPRLHGLFPHDVGPVNQSSSSGLCSLGKSVGRRFGLWPSDASIPSWPSSPPGCSVPSPWGRLHAPSSHELLVSASL